jgi:molybdopterin/thiamine biosynthesis adenylyltransferase/rhodanese-related sulfurtransferase
MVNQNSSIEGIDLTHSEILRYSRHLLLPEVGLQGQKKLKASSILVIGTGGLGSPVSMYLAAAGVGHIGLVDFDSVDLNNLQRQIVHGTSTIGDRKVHSARKRLLDINPSIQIDVYDEPFTSENAFQIADPYDLIIDGTDNFPTRYLTNDVCVLTGKPNIYGSIFRFEGQVSVFWAEKGPCYRCLFPEPPPPGSVPTCADAGVFGVLPGIIGTLQATEALKLLLGIGEPLIGRLLLYDGLTASLEELSLKKNPKCKICSDNPEITKLIDYEAFCGVPAHDIESVRLPGEWEIEPHQVAEMLKNDAQVQLIDVREPHELEISRIEGADLIPLGSLASEMHELDSTQEIILICRSGSRSARALEILVGAGFEKIKNLRGGINAWAEQVDPSLPHY